jgi:hypothetical protein
MRRHIALLLGFVAAACGSSTPTGPSPTTPVPPPPAAQTHVLSGRVIDAATGQGVASARIQFMTGVNAGRLTVAGSDGRYTLSELRTGSGLMRAYGPQHSAVERTIALPAAADVDFTVTAATPANQPAPYTYRGIVWDSRGSPVSGATVSMIRDSGANPLAVVTTGAEGSFTVTTQTTANTVRVTRDGHLPRENPAPPVLSATTEVNVTLPRITTYRLQEIPPLRVGQSATLMAEVVTDDGLTSVGRAYESTSSSSETVASAELGNILARAPGTTVITAFYSGLTATLTLQVIP